jgi:hypothetical protein
MKNLNIDWFMVIADQCDNKTSVAKTALNYFEDFQVLAGANYST